MKIQESMGKSSQIAGKLELEEKKSVHKSSVSFDNQLKKLDYEHAHEKMSLLLEKIAEQSKKLSESVNIKDLRLYKKLVSEFLYDAVNYSHKFNKESILDRRGRHRMYAIISKVNTEIDELTQEVLKEEKDNIKILQKLDDIRGLLLDIFM